MTTVITEAQLAYIGKIVDGRRHSKVIVETASNKVTFTIKRTGEIIEAELDQPE